MGSRARKAVRSGLFGLLCMGLGATPAWANGMALGPSVSSAAGTTQVEVSDLGVRVMGTETRGLIGLTFDTAVSGDDRFGYRGTIGLGGYNSRVFWPVSQDRLRLTGLTLNHTLTVRLAQIQNVRVWAGPHITLAAHTGNFDEQWDLHVSLAEALIGINSGFNAQVNPSTSICIGLHAQGGGVTGMGSNTPFAGDSFHGIGWNVGGSVGLLFQPKPSDADR